MSISCRILRVYCTNVLIAVTFFYSCESRAHHKVHNLALYPERHSWCQATPIRQEIAQEECSPSTIDNLVCLGACFSYSVPRADDEVAIPAYCDACRPTIYSWTKVTLNCTRASTGEHYEIRKKVEMISNCSCVDCINNTPRQKVDYQEKEDSVESGEVFHHEPPIKFIPMEENELTDHHHHKHQQQLKQDENNIETDYDDDDDNTDDNVEDIDGVNNGDDIDEMELNNEGKYETVHQHHQHQLGHGLDTLHKLKSDSAETKSFHFKPSAADEEELMINQNKIPDDDPELVLHNHHHKKDQL